MRWETGGRIEGKKVERVYGIYEDGLLGHITLIHIQIDWAPCKWCRWSSLQKRLCSMNLVFHDLWVLLHGLQDCTILSNCKALFHLVCFQSNTQVRLSQAGICMPIAPVHCFSIGFLAGMTLVTPTTEGDHLQHPVAKSLLPPVDPQPLPSTLHEQQVATGGVRYTREVRLLQ